MNRRRFKNLDQLPLTRGKHKKQEKDPHDLVAY